MAAGQLGWGKAIFISDTDLFDNDFLHDFDNQDLLFNIMSWLATSARPNLIISAHSPADILVTDPSGARVGYDPLMDDVINEIPGAIYSGPRTDPQEISIPSPLQGVYTVDIFGTGTGSYTMTITSVGADGVTTDTQTWIGTTASMQHDRIMVQILDDGNFMRGPIAFFTESTHTSVVGASITFDPAGSYDTDGSIVLYEWDWESDGVYDLSSLSPDIASYTYMTTGTFTVTLRVTDNDGLTGTTTAIKVIRPPDETVPEILIDTVLLVSVAFIAFGVMTMWGKRRIN